MRRMLIFSFALAIAVALSAGDVATTSERQAVDEIFKIQLYIKGVAERKGLEAVDRIREFAHGILSAEASKTFARWDSTVVHWKKERGSGAAPHLADGVMWDCLSRMGGVVTPPMFSELSGLSGYYSDWERARPLLAVKAFDRALKQDSTILEARFRRARILAPTDADAARDLERLAAADADPVIAYLSAVSRAEAAVRRKEPPVAIQWYERALTMSPRSTAATIALSLLTRNVTVELGDLDASDAYYRYPCRILTPAVDSELTRRMQLPRKP